MAVTPYWPKVASGTPLGPSRYTIASLDEKPAARTFPSGCSASA
jgi:hypothetical protein